MLTSYHHLGHFSQSSFATSGQPSNSNNKNRKTILPQLLAFGDNRLSATGNSITIIGDRYAHHDKNYTGELTETNYHDSASNRTSNVPEEIKEFEPTKHYVYRTGIIEEKTGGTEDKHELNERFLPESNSDAAQNQTGLNNTSHFTSDSADQLISTVDYNNLPRNETTYSNNEVTITDIDDETLSKFSERTVENTFSHDDELTDAISSSLLATPKTVGESSREYTDFEEIAMLISRASPDRRVIIKKKVPEVSTRGYNKNCNEKLIFSGNKITHVKTDRKTMCRDYYPKQIEN